MKSPKLLSPSLEQPTVTVSRRQVMVQLMGLAAAPLLLLGMQSPAMAAEVTACFDLDALPASQKSTRRSLGFKQATVDGQNCGACAFFTPSAGGCGHCAMLSGGIVSTAYVCESWAAKT